MVVTTFRTPAGDDLVVLSRQEYDLLCRLAARASLHPEAGRASPPPAAHPNGTGRDPAPPPADAATSRARTGCLTITQASILLLLKEGEPLTAKEIQERMSHSFSRSTSAYITLRSLERSGIVVQENGRKPLRGRAPNVWAVSDLGRSMLAFVPDLPAPGSLSYRTRIHDLPDWPPQ